MENGNDRRDQAEKHLKDTIERNDRKLASTDENERILETRCESRDVRDESRAAVTRGGREENQLGMSFIPVGVLLGTGLLGGLWRTTLTITLCIFRIEHY